MEIDIQFETTFNFSIWCRFDVENELKPTNFTKTPQGFLSPFWSPNFTKTSKIESKNAVAGSVIYIGEFYDDSAQLSYLNARYYNPATARFVSEDPVFSWNQQNLANPQSFNAYSYAGNNPLGNRDPLGLFSISGTLKSTAGSVWGTGAGTISLIANVYNSPRTTLNAITQQAASSLQSIGTGRGSQTTQNFFLGTDEQQDVILGGILGDTAVGFATGTVGSKASGTKYFTTGIKEVEKLAVSKLNLSEHAQRRMSERGISADQINKTLGNIDPFPYWLEGTAREGFYDPASKLFVGKSVDTGNVTTVMNNVSPNYIRNLKKLSNN